MKARPRPWLYVFIALACLAAIGLTFKPQSTSQRWEAEAKEFKATLIQLISESDRIDVVEHSWSEDFWDERGMPLEGSPNLEYKRISLSAEQRKQFKEAFEGMSDAPKMWFSACSFAPHHSIELFSKNGGKNEILVCFQCGDTRWYQSDRNAPSGDRQVYPDGNLPEEFQNVFRRFIEPLGFQGSRNWEKLAKDRAGANVEPLPGTSPQLESAPAR